MGRRPSRVPVTARAQLSALHPLVRSLITAAMAAATKDRTMAAFIFAVFVFGERSCEFEDETTRLTSKGNTERKSSKRGAKGEVRQRGRRPI